MNKNVIYLLIAVIAVAVAAIFLKPRPPESFVTPEALPTNGIATPAAPVEPAPVQDPNAAIPMDSQAPVAGDPNAPATPGDPTTTIPAVVDPNAIPAPAVDAGATAPAANPYPTADGIPAPVTAPAAPIDTGGVPVTPSEGQ